MVSKSLINLACVDIYFIASAKGMLIGNLLIMSKNLMNYLSLSFLDGSCG